MRTTVFVFAFGRPKPLHMLVLANWAACTCFHFVILTDNWHVWDDLSVKAAGTPSSNLSVVEVSVISLFDQAAKLLDFEDSTALMAAHKDLFFGEMNNWTVCGLRGLLADIYPDIVQSPLWGFCDYDVLLSPRLVATHVQQHADKDILFAPAESFMWEQFKLFSRRIRMPFHYLHLLRGNNRPLEAALVYHLRGMRLTTDALPQTMVAAHWKHTDDDPRSEPNRQDVRVVGGNLYNNRTEGPIMIFIADTEVKLFRAQSSVYSWSRAAMLAAR